MRQPGVEPGSTAWKATMLTVTPPTLGRDECFSFIPHKVGQSIRIRYFPHGLYARKTFISLGGVAGDWCALSSSLNNVFVNEQQQQIVRNKYAGFVFYQNDK